MFDRKNSEFFFTKSLRFGLLEDRLYGEIDICVDSSAIADLTQRAMSAGKKADIYWTAYRGVTNPIEPPRIIFHNPPTLQKVA